MKSFTFLKALKFCFLGCFCNNDYTLYVKKGVDENMVGTNGIERQLKKPKSYGSWRNGDLKLPQHLVLYDSLNLHFQSPFLDHSYANLSAKVVSQSLYKPLSTFTHSTQNPLFLSVNMKFFSAAILLLLLLLGTGLFVVLFFDLFVLLCSLSSVR